MRAPQQGVIVPGSELFRNAPGYNPLDLQGDAPRSAAAPLQFLVATTQEDWRGGRIDVTEFVPPAPDIAMHFYQPISTDNEGLRYGIANILATSSLSATVTYDNSPAAPPRSGIYYTTPHSEDCFTYQLNGSELVVGRPRVQAIPEPEACVLADRADTEHAADAFRVVDNTGQLAILVDKFGLALGLNQADRDTFANSIAGHVHAMRRYRRMKGLGEAIVALRSNA